MGRFVTHHTTADTARERARMWRLQRLFAAALTCGSIGAVWLAATMGTGAAGAAAVIVAGLAPVAVALPIAAPLVARARRRAVLWGSPAAMCAAFAACLLAAGTSGVALVVACAAVVGVARTLFDAATTDTLQQLVPAERRPDSAHALTQQFGAGSALGGAGTLLAGLVAGPQGAIALAALLAGAAAVVAARHHPDMDLRIDHQPAVAAALRGAAGTIASDRLLRRVLAAGAWSAGVGAAQGAVLIVWLKDGVGLRGALVPALMAGFVAVRLSRPLVRRIAGRARMASLLTLALSVQAAASVAAWSADGTLGASAAYGLSLAAGAFLAILVTRALRLAAGHDLAPAVGLAAGSAWATAGCAGAVAGGVLSATAGMAATHLVLAAVAGSVAAGVAARAAVWGGGFLLQRAGGGR
ncbi:hypothetical protein [Miltoncostaea marina]|uniref:hypothetical protein n=1 Tax=Miltoncostaea marina TaxID=2843215 RepID=UPI001C3E711A|nr:hypothetical protein [Miltoncostaea marina]